MKTRLTLAGLVFLGLSQLVLCVFVRQSAHDFLFADSFPRHPLGAFISDHFGAVQITAPLLVAVGILTKRAAPGLWLKGYALAQFLMWQILLCSGFDALVHSHDVVSINGKPVSSAVESTK